MPENRVTAGPGPDINSAVALVSMVFLAVVGPQAVVVQPAFIEGLVSQLGFDPVQAGYVSAAENTGKAVMSIAMMFLVTRVNWRHLFYVALFLLITLACILPPVLRQATASRVLTRQGLLQAPLQTAIWRFRLLATK